jgi:hypothetical protein
MTFQKALWTMAVAGLLSGCAVGSSHRLQADPGLNPFDGSADDSDVSERFDRNVRTAFPPGTPVPVMVARLEAAGFDVDLQSRSANLNYGVSMVIIAACATDFDVRWTGDEVVETVDASYYSACL